MNTDTKQPVSTVDMKVSRSVVPTNEEKPTITGKALMLCQYLIMDFIGNAPMHVVRYASVEAKTWKSAILHCLDAGGQGFIRIPLPTQ